MKKGLMLACIMFVVAFCFVTVVPRDASAVERWMVIGPTNWTVEGSNLMLNFTESFNNDLSVTSATTGDLQWIKTSPLIAYGAKINQVALCYVTPNPGTSIMDIRLVDYALTTGAAISDINPIPASPSGNCYFSPNLGGIQPTGALYIALRLNFASTSDSIRIGALGILIDE